MDEISLRNVAVLKWVEAKNQWHLETVNGHLLQEFFNCDSFSSFFPSPKKDKLNLYKIEITRISS